MSGIKYFPQDLNLENKTIILRVDLNVPIIEKKIPKRNIKIKMC